MKRLFGLLLGTVILLFGCTNEMRKIGTSSFANAVNMKCPSCFGNGCDFCNEMREVLVYDQNEYFNLLRMYHPEMISIPPIPPYTETNGGQQPTASGKPMEECFDCHGTGWVPNGASVAEITGNGGTTCPYAGSRDHICRIEPCQICRRSHCVRLVSHKKCKYCNNEMRSVPAYRR